MCLSQKQLIPDEWDQRQEVIRQAKGFLHTPYHHQGRLLGVGVDCAMLVAEVYERAGLTPHIPTPEYPPDWHFHRSDEKFMGIVLRFAREADEPLPGGLVMFRFGRCLSHGGIIVEWPLIIHSYINVGHVTYANIDTNPALAKRVAGFYTHKTWER